MWRDTEVYDPTVGAKVTAAPEAKIETVAAAS
jgi:hypothetical protein